MGITQPIREKKELEKFKSYYQIIKPNSRNNALIITGLNTSLRISDILSLTWGDVYDFETRTWLTHIQLKEQKTGKNNMVFINHAITKALNGHKANSTSRKELYIFGSHAAPSSHLSRSQAFRIIREAADFAELGPGVSCHSLRKTFGYHAWKQGVSPALLMDIYNHSSYAVTKRYLGIEQDDKDEVFQRIKL